ncbi:LOW QUALITY PROTEIN: coiled-coil domain-containing protein 162-like [Spheniscus humboldti]
MLMFRGPTLKNTYLLEFHPSLGLVCLIPKALEYTYQEFYSICRPKTASKASNLEKQVLQLVVDEWLTMEKTETFYSSQIQKDLFAEVLLEDPVLVQEIALSLLEVGADEEKKTDSENQLFILDSFSMMLELATLCHRLIEVATESARLARFYKAFAIEAGFGEFHLYLRPTHFESASHKEKADHLPPIFITSLLEDDSCVDRYIPSSLPLSIQEIDSHIGKLSFRTRDDVMQLLCPSGIRNTQLILACQVIQKNALLAAVQQASFCYLVQPPHAPDIKMTLLSSHTFFSLIRLPEAFISVQLEKRGPDRTLNTFTEKREALGSRLQNPDEVLKLKRDVIVEYCHKVNQRVSQHALRGQLIGYYNSLRSLLDDFPIIRDKYFIIGLPQGKKEEQDLKKNLAADPRFVLCLQACSWGPESSVSAYHPEKRHLSGFLRSFHPRPRFLLSPDGLAFLNLWFIPHPTEALILFKMLPEKAVLRALHLSLEIVGAFHDVVSCLLAFAQLGNSPNCFCALNPEPLTPDWGGTDRIRTELQEIQKMIDSLQNPLDPSEVAQLLAVHREVILLQFDAAIRHRLRETFLSSGNVSAYHVTDRIYHALPPLSNSAIQSAFASQLRVPQLLDPQSCRLCLYCLRDADRRVAHGELVAMQFLMEDVLQNSYGCAVEDHADCQASLAKSKQVPLTTLFGIVQLLCRTPISFCNQISVNISDLDLSKTFPRDFQQNLAETDHSSANWLQNSKKTSKLLLRHHDPVISCNLLRSFLILWKQLEILKVEWGRLKLRTEDINTVPIYKEFCEQYGYLCMKALENTVVMQQSTEEAMLSRPVPIRPRHFRLTSLNRSQKICVCSKELLSDLLHSGLHLFVSQCYLPCITSRSEGAQSNAGGPRSLPLFYKLCPGSSSGAEQGWVAGGLGVTGASSPCRVSNSLCFHHGAGQLWESPSLSVSQPLCTQSFPVVMPGIGLSSYCLPGGKLQKLLESLEIHMIHDVQKKINQEMTLVTSERARQDSSLPTELWKHRVMQENFSVVRPQIVETFVPRLMENYQESDREVTFTKSHLQQCLTILGCDIMARERSNFETYSMVNENILQQQHRLLYQKEQELHAVEEGGNQSDMALTQIVGLCRGMIMEIVSQSPAPDLEEENLGLKERIRKEVRDEYGSLVRNLFVTCVHLKGKLDVYRLSIEQRMFEIISEVRREGTDNMIDLKKKFGSTKNNGDLKERLSKVNIREVELGSEEQEQLQLLRDENIRLSKLVCKLKALNCWKQTTQKAQLSAKLRDAEKEALQNKKECLNAKMMAEQEVTISGSAHVCKESSCKISVTYLGRNVSEFDKTHLVNNDVGRAGVQNHTDSSKQMLLEVVQRKTQEAKKRQVPSVMKAENIEKMLEGMEEKEQRVNCLTKEAEISSKTCHLQQKGVKKELQQIRSQLTQECSLKWEAFQQVDELQCQVYDLEAAVSQRNATAGSAAQVQSNKLSGSTQHGDYQQHPLNFDPRSSKGIGGNTQRPKTVPSRWKERTADRLSPHLNEKSLPNVFMQLRKQRLV